MSQETEIPPLKIGELFSQPHWSSGPVRIVHVFDARTSLTRDHPAYGRGYMGVRESGNIDVFWHRWAKTANGGFHSRLTHHGGVAGFPDIDIPIRQCRRIIRGYLGIEETLDMTDDLTEQEERPPVSLREFGDLISQSAEVVSIPGHQAWAMDVKAQIDRAVRQVVSRPGFLHLGNSLNELQHLRQKLDRSRNPFLNQAGTELEIALTSDDRFAQLAALQRGGQRMLDRMVQIDSQVVSVMLRHNRLEAHRTNSETNVRRLYFGVLQLQNRWSILAEGDLTLAAVRLAADSRIYLDSLIANPYKEKSKKFDSLRSVDATLREKGKEAVALVIQRNALDLHDWKDDIDEAQKGRFTDRYPVKEN